ncbi:MAG: PRC-barrel domain-containing protein, partial [Solirubrobacteraceae bacterium]
AETVGKIDGFVVDPQRRAVVAIECKKTDSGDILLWSDIVGFGTDAVTVNDASAITEAPADIDVLLGKDHHLLGKRILSSAGDELGKVDDVEFDPESGVVKALSYAEGQIEGARLIGVGSYAIVVTPG